MTDRPVLTPREEQVARLIAQGMTYAEIGSQLSMSPHTVRIHVRAVAVKIGENGSDSPKTRVRHWGYVRFG